MCVKGPQTLVHTLATNCDRVQQNGVLGRLRPPLLLRGTVVNGSSTGLRSSATASACTLLKLLALSCFYGDTYDEPMGKRCAARRNAVDAAV